MSQAWSSDLYVERVRGRVRALSDTTTVHSCEGTTEPPAGTDKTHTRGQA